MDSRERYIRAMTRGGPDRVPLMHRTLPGAFTRYGSALHDLYRRYPSDVLLSPKLHAPFAFWEAVREDSGGGKHIADAWGCIWDKLTDDYQGQVVEEPLDDWNKWSSYRLPDPRLGSDGVAELAAVVQTDGHRHYVIASVGSLWHRLTYLRGFENACIDITEGNPLFIELCDAVVGYLLDRIDIWSKHREADGILIEDDWGTQESLMISPHSWRRIFKPRYQRLVAAIHAVGAYAHLHTDGNTHAIVEDLIEVGFDEINPQMSCMNAALLARQAGGKVGVRADIDRQRLLPFGTPADVASHVRSLFDDLGHFNGGYIGYGQIGTDVPLANAESMLHTICQLAY